MVRTPETLRYAASHEWVDLDGDVATVGISSFAVAELTDLVFIALPQVGKVVSAGEEFGEVESVKAVSSLYAPIGGTIMEVNTALPDHLEMLSQDPYSSGWIIKLKPANAADAQKLMDYAAYKKQCGG